MKSKPNSSISSYKYALWSFISAIIAAVLSLIPALIISNGVFSFPTAGFLFSLIAPYAGNFVGIVTLIFFTITMGLSSLSAYLYISQFASHSVYTVAASLMYSFSGVALAFVGHSEWSGLLIFMPMLLWSTEQFFIYNKKAYLPLFAALCLLCSNAVAIGLPIIWLIYCILRRKDFSVNLSAKKVLLLVAEWLLAVALTAILLLPEFFSLSEVSISSILGLLTSGAILNLNSIFEILSHLSQYIFPSLAHAGTGAGFNPVWLPLIGLSSGIALVFSSKYHKLQGALRLCTILMMITCLFGGNAIHWWVIVPTLLFAASGAIVLSDKSKDNPGKSTFLWLMAITSAWVVLMGVLFAMNKLTVNAAALQSSIILAVASVLAGMLIILYKPKASVIMGVTVIICGGVFGSAFYHGFMQYPEAFVLRADQPTIVNTYFAGENDRLELPSGDEYLAKPWGRESLATPPGNGSIAELAAISTLGVDNPYKINDDNFALRNLLSCRWKLVPNGQPVNLVGYEYYGRLGSLDVYQNLYSLPIGIIYDTYIPAHILQQAPPEQKAQLALKGIAIRPEDIPKVSSILTPVAENDLDNLTVYDSLNDCYFLSSRKIDSIHLSRTGFTAQTNFDRERVVFFSIPYSSSASCLIDGKPSEILLAGGGYMGIIVPEGQNTIVVDRYPFAAMLGQWISLGAAVIALIYFIIMRSLDIKAAYKAKKALQLQTNTDPSPLDMLEPPPIIKTSVSPAQSEPEPEQEPNDYYKADYTDEDEDTLAPDGTPVVSNNEEDITEQKQEQEIIQDNVSDNDIDDDNNDEDEDEEYYYGDALTTDDLDYVNVVLTINPPPDVLPVEKAKEAELPLQTIDENASPEEIQLLLATQKQKRDEKFKEILSKRNK
ncbi:MAG: hypothetical protein RRZ73_03930 [Oscillospiraceae bacterium]